MIFPEQLPVLLVIIPLLSAFLISIFGWLNKKLCYPMTILAMAGSLYASVGTLIQVLDTGVIHYRLGAWPPPIGIEYVIDHLNGLVLVVVSAVGLMAAIFSKKSVEAEMGDRISIFYTLFVLLVTGLLGMTVTGDAFNLYVLLEISALTSYALIAMGKERALIASFNYLMLGTIAASLYLLGVGHLYIMTGSLNMADLQALLPGLYQNKAILVAFILILVGVLAKMAFLPLHTWLPNGYTYAPSATSCLIAPLMTKVSVYVMIRMMFSVFTADYAFNIFGLQDIIVWLAVAAIVGGSLLALAQTTDFKKMLTYLIVSEVGYMVGGVWLANSYGITGAILHIVNDAMMTLCLFLAVGAIVYKTGGHTFANLQGIYKKMPLTMAAFTVGALSMIGVPPTAGFFSKWYLILGAIDAGQWGFVVALLFSSLVNAIVFFRIIEIGFFEPFVEGHGHSHANGSVIAEAPFSMLLPLVITAVGIIVVGFYTGEIVTTIITQALPPGM